MWMLQVSISVTARVSWKVGGWVWDDVKSGDHIFDVWLWQFIFQNSWLTTISGQYHLPIWSSIFHFCKTNYLCLSMSLWVYDMIWLNSDMIWWYWYDMIWYDMIWWYDMILFWFMIHDMIMIMILIIWLWLWHDMILNHELWFMVVLLIMIPDLNMIWFDMIWYDMIWYDIICYIILIIYKFYKFIICNL